MLNNIKKIVDVMFKHCLKCGIKNNELAPFCSNYGEKFEDEISDFEKPTETEKIDSFEQQSSDIHKEPVSFEETRHVEPVSDYQPYGQPSPDIPEKQSKKTKPIIAVAVIAIAAIVVAASFYVIYIVEETEKSEFDKLIDNLKDSVKKYCLGIAKSKIDGGPTLNLQSLASGNFQTIPEKGRIAKYNLYRNGAKIGTATEEAVGTEMYKGKEYLLILGSSDVKISSYLGSTAFTMDYKYYVEADSKMPVFMSIFYDYKDPDNLDMQIELTWNQDSHEIKSTTSLMGRQATITSKLPEEYWGMVSSIDDLYVGFVKNIAYTMSFYGESYNVDLTFSITSQEDVLVPAGTFENCYIFEFEQDFSELSHLIGDSNINMKIWISEKGVVPKAEVILLSEEITQELEGYYTTAS